MWEEPNQPIGHAFLNMKQIRPDAWVCGDPSLLDKAGSYFQRLFKYQRHEQAKLRQKEIRKYGYPIHPFVFCYPLNNWFQKGYKLTTFDNVERFPWLGLYLIELPKFTDERKRTRYFEDIQTLTVFPYKQDDPEDVYKPKYHYLNQQ